MTIVYLQNSPFFTEQLTAFQVWLAMGAENRDPPEQLPIVLQVLLSQVHRLRALDLLGRFLDLGPWAVNLVSWHVIKQETVVPCRWQVFAVKQVDMGHIATLKENWRQKNKNFLFTLKTMHNNIFNFFLAYPSFFHLKFFLFRFWAISIAAQNGRVSGHFCSLRRMIWVRHARTPLKNASACFLC